MPAIPTESAEDIYKELVTIAESLVELNGIPYDDAMREAIALREQYGKDKWEARLRRRQAEFWAVDLLRVCRRAVESFAPEQTKPAWVDDMKELIRKVDGPSRSQVVNDEEIHVT